MNLKHLKTVFTTICVIFSALFLTSLVNFESELNTVMCVFIFIYFMLISLVLVFLSQKYIVKERKIRILLFTGCMVASIVITIMGQTNFFPNDAKKTITVSAYGNKNEAALSAEAWLVDITINGKKSHLSEAKIEGDWKYDKEYDDLVYIPKGEGTVSFTLRMTDQVDLIFAKSEYSGLIGIDDGERYSEIDLYAKDAETYVYTAASIQKNENNPRKIIYVIGCILFFYYIAKNIFYVFYNKVKSQKKISGEK